MTNLILSTARRLRADSKGVTALEYGLIASLIAVFLIASLTALGTGLSTTFASISAKL